MRFLSCTFKSMFMQLFGKTIMLFYFCRTYCTAALSKQIFAMEPISKVLAEFNFSMWAKSEIQIPRIFFLLKFLPAKNSTKNVILKQEKLMT